MQSTRVFLIVIAASTAVCAPQASQPAGKAPSAGAHSVRWAPALGLDSLAQIDARLKRPFDDTFTVRGKGQSATVKSCADYLDLRKKGFAPTAEKDLQVLRARGIECVALQALRSAKPARQSALAGFLWDADATKALPPSLAIGVSGEATAKAKQAETQGRSWGEFEPGTKVSPEDADGVTVQGKGWLSRLTQYGRGDFDGDGWEDLLVRADEALLQGTYRNSRLLPLTRTRPAGPLRTIKELP